MLGQTLRVLREKTGKSLGQLADETGYEKSYLSRLESGERLSKVTVMEDLDGYYGTGDLLLSHWKAARLDAFKDQYKEYMALEATVLAGSPRASADRGLRSGGVVWRPDNGGR